MEREDDVGVALPGAAIEYGELPLGRRPIDQPFAVLLEIMRRYDIGRVCYVHLVDVIRVRPDEDGAVLGVEGEVCDVDVTGRLENPARLPVKSTVVVEQHPDPIEVRDQFFRPGENISKI